MQDTLPDIYPDYVGVTIPAEIAPLNFNGADDGIDCIDVVVKGSKGGELHAQGDVADFDIDDWHQLTLQNKGGELTFTVCMKQDGQWKQYKDFKVYVSVIQPIRPIPRASYSMCVAIMGPRCSRSMGSESG